MSSSRLPTGGKARGRRQPALVPLLCVVVLSARAWGPAEAGEGGPGRDDGADRTTRPAGYAAVKTVDHTGKVEYRVLEVSRTLSPPEVAELRDSLRRAYDTARGKWLDTREGPRPGRPRVKELGPPVATREEAEALIQHERNADLDRLNPGRALRRRILEERFFDHFVFGLDQTPGWFEETRAKNGCRWDVQHSYLSGAAEPGDTGDKQWFFKYGLVRRMLAWGDRNDVVTWFCWYTLAASHPARYKPGPAQATPVNARHVGTMRSYFEIFKRLMLECAKHPNAPTVVQIEPDEWCHLLLSAGMDPEKVDVKVGSTGMPEIEDLPDDEVGWSKAFLRLRDMYAPHVLLACNPSFWDWRGRMSPAGLERAFKKMASDRYDLMIGQSHDWDLGLRSNGGGAKWPPYTEADFVARFRSFDVMLRYVHELVDRMGLPLVMWQVPMGNAHFRTCDGSDRHGCDGWAEAVLFGYPENDVIARFERAGCVGILFTSGASDRGTMPGDKAGDGITNPEPIPGNKGHVARYADDDGGFMRIFGGKYYERPHPVRTKFRRRGAVAVRKAGPTTGGLSRDESGARAERPAKKALKPDALAEWDAKLMARLKEELAAGRTPRFAVATFQQGFEVISVDGSGTLKLKSAVTDVDLEWSRLELRDRRNLALALLRDGNPDDHCLAAFYLIATGSEQDAREHLSKGGEGAAAVEASFTTAGASAETAARSGRQDGPDDTAPPRSAGATKPGEYRQAGRALRRRPRQEAAEAPAADPDAAKLFEEAETAFIDGDAEKARELFEKTLRDHPESEFAAKAREYLGILE